MNKKIVRKSQRIQKPIQLRNYDNLVVILISLWVLFVAAIAVYLIFFVGPG